MNVFESKYLTENNIIMQMIWRLLSPKITRRKVISASSSLSFDDCSAADYWRIHNILKGRELLLIVAASLNRSFVRDCQEESSWKREPVTFWWDCFLPCRRCRRLHWSFNFKLNLHSHSSSHNDGNSGFVTKKKQCSTIGRGFNDKTVVGGALRCWHEFHWRSTDHHHWRSGRDFHAPSIYHSHNASI